jgi:hypothetical protein
VRDVLVRAHRAALDGHWAAVMVGNEAAPAFDAALKTTTPVDELPLAGAAIYGDEADNPAAREPAPHATGAGLDFTPVISRDVFVSRVRAVHEHIREGNTYQANLTFPLEARAPSNLEALYETLLPSQQASYCALIDLGRYVILSFSPELFFARTSTQLTMRPMKGTARRGRWRDEDLALAASLRESPKERAENVMIVDLLRSDVGRIALTGSVRTPQLFTLERYPTVWQMTSTIEATVPPATTLVDIFAALFPCGSVTGAPDSYSRHPGGARTRAPWRLYRSDRDCPARRRLRVQRRHPYPGHRSRQAARQERPDADDVVLWNARGEVTESTIANLVIERDGVRITPPITSGLLPGIAREELIERGEIREGVVTKEALAGASRIWLLNSLRGYVKATLIR